MTAILRHARFSKDRKYRYCLWRVWCGERPLVNFIGLNPSTADERQDDPTLTRCIGFARRWGFGGMVMTNLFALRATHPKEMLDAPRPVGRNNTRWLGYIANLSALVVVAWGQHGNHKHRDEAVIATLGDSYCLGHTAGGLPRHPLYCPQDSCITPYSLNTKG